MGKTLKNHNKYGNCVIQAPDGVILCRTSEKKVRWYLSRDLAVKISDNPSTIRLRFEPSGRSGVGEAYSFAVRQNICVACGTTRDLTRHHIIPYCYRRYMQDGLKEHSSYDVVMLCRHHHDLYETHAMEFKAQLAEKYGFVDKTPQNIDVPLVRAMKAARTIAAHGNKIPVERLNSLKAEICDYLQIPHGEVPIEQLSLLAEKPRKATLEVLEEVYPFPKSVIGKIIEKNELKNFIVTWRQHFLDHVKPEFMPSYWDLNKDI